MGNRGLLHNDRREIVRPWQVKRWIYCVLEFHGRRREVMRPGYYTELFFLDEATALAAGHRPCMECQRERGKEFKRIWNEVNEPVRTVAELDEILHRERTGARPLVKISELQNGTMVADDEKAYLVHNHELLKWSFEGYSFVGRPAGEFKLVTPESIIRVLAAGFSV
jgi:hypothetical protein